MKKNFLRDILIIVAIMTLAYVLVKVGMNISIAPIDLSRFDHELAKGNIKEVIFINKTINGKFNTEIEIDQKKFWEFRTQLPDMEIKEIVDELVKKNVKIGVKEKGPSFFEILSTVGFLGLTMVIIFMIFKQLNSANSNATSFGKVKTNIQKDVKVKFTDVAGCVEAKNELEEIIEFLKNPKKFTKLGGKIPKGVLLIGAPGTGKTLLAKAVAGEANVPFLTVSGSEFVELFVGVGASRVRDLFNKAKQLAPSIIFIDEIDAVGRHRGAGLGGGHDEREQTLNQLLVEMDGFESNEGVIIISATNRPDILDPALLRPGRFDRRIVVPIPDVVGRKGILKVHTKEIPLHKKVNFVTLAKGTPGMSGADLANLVNEAALLAAKKNRDSVKMEDFEEAKDKVLMGLERKSMILSPEEKKLTAYHETGHALVGLMMVHGEDIHKVTIIPRGMSLGATVHLPKKELHNYSKEYLIDSITTLLGGRAAEEVFLNTKTTGAENDLQRATDITRKMVTKWGMSEELGPMFYSSNDSDEIFLGRSIAVQKTISEKTIELIDIEIRRMIEEQFECAKKVLRENKDLAEHIAETLIIKEVLTGEQLKRMVKRFEVKKK